MATQVTESIIVKAKIHDVYNIWANYENFPQFMKNIKAVTRTDETTSHWEMEGPLGKKIEWNAKTTRLEEDKRVAWNSTDGDIVTTGQVLFNALNAEETELTVTVQYVPPAGLAGEIIAKLFSDPEGKLDEDLHNFKVFVESKGGTADYVAENSHSAKLQTSVQN